jgi:hypothetical protein
MVIRFTVFHGGIRKHANRVSHEKELAMPIPEPVLYPRQEHREILRVADRIARALELISAHDFSARQEGLTELRAVQHGLLGIVQHCHSEDGVIESEYHRYLDADRYAQIKEQHQSILRLVNRLSRELPYATADSIVEVGPLGEEIVEQVREHVAYEEEMLDCVDQLRVAAD